MLSDTVAQKPTTPVSDGTKKRKNSPKVWNLDGVASIGPKPPALLRAQSSSARPMRSRHGAEMPCRNRIVSMPRKITRTLSSQNAAKHTEGPHAKWPQLGVSATSRASMSAPTSNDERPNQPHAQTAQRIAG